MAWEGNTHRMFRAVANALILDDADDSMLHDVLAALMDDDDFDDDLHDDEPGDLAYEGSW